MLGCQENCGGEGGRVLLKGIVRSTSEGGRGELPGQGQEMPGGRLQATVQFKHSPADPHQTQALSQGSPMQGKVINLRTLI